MIRSKTIMARANNTAPTAQTTKTQTPAQSAAANAFEAAVQNAAGEEKKATDPTKWPAIWDFSKTRGDLRNSPIVMVGIYRGKETVTPKEGQPFDVYVFDHAAACTEELKTEGLFYRAGRDEQGNATQEPAFFVSLKCSANLAGKITTIGDPYAIMFEGNIPHPKEPRTKTINQFKVAVLQETTVKDLFNQACAIEETTPEAVQGLPSIDAVNDQPF